MEIIRESMRVGNLVDSFLNGKFRRNILLKRYCMLGMHTLFGSTKYRALQCKL